MAAAIIVANISCIECIACTLEVLAEGHGSVALFIINDLLYIVEICLLSLIAGSADTYAKVANSQHALGVLIGIDQDIIYICTHVGRFAFQDNMMLLTQNVGLAKSRNRCVVIGQVSVVIDVTAYDRLTDVECIDSPHHVCVAGGCTEADAGVVVD